ncbi:MAG: carboxypeptidase-like regulatory domain-containing protein [Bacteroides sp.]|nr:carboxypeptidase-like regulatory domain-containing protein [Bacteroides sp.]
MKRWVICLGMLLVWTNVLFGQIIVNGVVKDKESRKELANVNVSVIGSNVGTITNADGEFSLKLSQADAGKGLVISHVGYLNVRLSGDELDTEKKRLTIWMIPHTLTLKDVNVFGGAPRVLVEKAIQQIPKSYSDKNQMFSAFYRETIQKGSRYIGISEAVMDVYKSDYKNRSVYLDRVQLQKGRRLASQKKKDTLAVKIAGGPNMPVYLDLAKNEEELLSFDMLPCYRFDMGIPVSIDNRMQYVVHFQPMVKLEIALYKGTLYIDQESLAFTRAEFELDLSDKEKATKSILRKKPAGLRFKPQRISYLVSYRFQEGKPHLNYIRNEIRFKCDWKKRLFSSSFTTTSEMVMVDRIEQPEERIKSKDAFKQRDVFYDVVEEYWNEDFWQDYNIIEPTESLESAVKKLKKQK